MPIQLAPNVYWVGAIDWDIREFHGYVTEKGTTYNAFLILDDKITLIDTVKKEFLPEMLARIVRSSPRRRSTISSPTTSRWTIPAACPKPWP